MTGLSRRSALLAGATLSVLAGSTTDIVAQQPEMLPEIVIQAPRPIARPRRASAPAPPAAPAPAATPAAQEPSPEDFVGTMPIVADPFATVTVVPNDEIRRTPGATLGDLLNNKPGITGSSFAPGASSRPIIRGLDMNRVGIVENGIGSNGASDLGEDHFVPIDPLATNQIEVIRGPATLRHGSQAIGGVVSASNNRIPETSPCRAVVPAPIGIAQSCATGELRSGVSTVDQGRESGAILEAAGENVAVHADGYRRKTDDFRVPGNPFLFDPARPFTGRQRNTFTQSDGGSIGGSYLFHGGFIGAAVMQTNSLYGLPGAEAEDARTRIDAKQTKVLARGEYRPDAAAVDAIRLWAGATDYRHQERGLADALDPASDGVRQTFTNREQEGRVELQFAPVSLPVAALTTTIGIQGGHQKLTADGDAPGTQFNGLWDPNSNSRIATYAFNELAFTPSTRVQVAGRIENVRLGGMTPEFPADALPDGVDRPTVERHRSFAPASASAGLIQTLPWGLVASVTAQHVERAPRPAELFSRGAHDATATFDIGNPNLKIESARSFEVGLRRTTGPVRFELTGFHTRFNGFIYRNLTGVRCDATFESCGNPAGDLNQALYAQRDARFRGVEFQFQYDALPLWMGVVGVDAQYDIVRATFSDGGNVPRIPPQRLGGGIYYRDANWLARVSLLHAFDQNSIGGVETPTAGYNRLKAELSFTQTLKPVGFGVTQFTIGLVGDNLLNEAIRNHVAFNKDEVLLPGLNVRLFANLRF